CRAAARAHDPRTAGGRPRPRYPPGSLAGEPPPRRRRQIGLASPQPCQPACALAFDQRPERLADQGGFLAQPSVALRSLHQLVIERKGGAHSLPFNQTSIIMCIV